MEIKDLLIKELIVRFNNKVVKLRGDYVGSLFRIKSNEIDRKSMLTQNEKEKLKRDLRSNKNIILDEE